MWCALVLHIRYRRSPWSLRSCILDIVSDCQLLWTHTLLDGMVYHYVCTVKDESVDSCVWWIAVHAFFEALAHSTKVIQTIQRRLNERVCRQLYDISQWILVLIKPIMPAYSLGQTISHVLTGVSDVHVQYQTPDPIKDSHWCHMNCDLHKKHKGSGWVEWITCPFRF